MKSKVIIFVILPGLMIIGIRACYLKDYITVLRYPEENTKIFISSDSIPIAPYLYVENATTLGAVINFETLKDSLFLQDLNVSIYSPDNPKQSIRLDHVSTPIHPVTGNNGNLDHLEANSFNDLPIYYRTIRNSGLPYNAIIFYFKTRQIHRTDFYNFKINGKILYKGQLFSFEKEIKTERKVEYHPYRMMT